MSVGAAAPNCVWWGGGLRVPFRDRVSCFRFVLLTLHIWLFISFRCFFPFARSVSMPDGWELLVYLKSRPLKTDPEVQWETGPSTDDSLAHAGRGARHRHGHRRTWLWAWRAQLPYSVLLPCSCTRYPRQEPGHVCHNARLIIYTLTPHAVLNHRSHRTPRKEQS